eukprot:6670629-Prymnesium_polylepis.1
MRGPCAASSYVHVKRAGYKTKVVRSIYVRAHATDGTRALRGSAVPLSGTRYMSLRGLIGTAVVRPCGAAAT